MTECLQLMGRYCKKDRLWRLLGPDKRREFAPCLLGQCTPEDCPWPERDIKTETRPVMEEHPSNYAFPADFVAEVLALAGRIGDRAAARHFGICRRNLGRWRRNCVHAEGKGEKENSDP